jgi:competence protein ComEA
VPALPISRRQALVAAVVLGILLLLGGKLLLRAGAPGAARPIPRPARVSAAAEAQARLVVDVVGAVRRPGLYRLREKARVADAVARAGGSTAKADLEGINLAAPIVDGQQVVVPRKVAAGAEPAAGEASSAAGASPTGPVSLSTATLEELDALPGVGPVTAQKILDYRTEHGAFHSVDELDAVSGIGPARLDSLRDLVVP